MAKVFTNGQMVGNTKAATLMTKKKGMEYTHILMDAVIKEVGMVENNMAKEFLSVLKASQEKANGKTGRDFTGRMKLIQSIQVDRKRVIYKTIESVI